MHEAAAATAPVRSPAGPDAAAGVMAWAEALQAAALVAVDPSGLGGVALRAGAGPVREAWLAALRAMQAPDRAWRRVPIHVSDERLLGGIDLAATLQAGRPVAQRGLLAEADGGIVLITMAERLLPGAVAHWATVMDHGEVHVERDGLSQRLATRFGMVALDEGQDGDEVCAPALLDRLAFHLDLHDIALADTGVGADRLALNGRAPQSDTLPGADAVAHARTLLPQVQLDDEQLASLATVAAALGIASLRAPLLAVRAARALAALEGRVAVSAQDVARAARLVLAPRATVLPLPPDAEPEPAEAPEAAEAPEPAEPPPPPSEGPATPPGEDPDSTPPPPEQLPEDLPPLVDIVLEAARAAIPAGLLARLRAGLAPGSAQRAAAATGRAGALQAGQSRGRPAGVRRGRPRPGARLNLIETLRAAAPWQSVRRAARLAQGGAEGTARLIEVRPDDFHTTRTQQRRETTTIFAVDASGSAALSRLAETKGAVELLLADCYVRRDRVAVLGFRGRVAEVLLPPTRSLVRAKRSLAGLPGGGGTPLAAGIDAAAALATSLRRRGETPVVVLLTDGRGNIARDGQPGRPRAEEDALHAARQLRLGGIACLLVDTSAQPAPQARRLADALGALYLPLPYAGSAVLSEAIQLGVKNATRR
jgi:magnesium chelatase subunit D